MDGWTGICVYIDIQYRQTDRWTEDKQTDRQPNRQTGEQTVRRKDLQTGGRTEGYTYRWIDTNVYI